MSIRETLRPSSNINKTSKDHRDRHWGQHLGQENIQPQLNILSDYLNASSPSQAPPQVRHALDLAMQFFSGSYSPSSLSSTLLNHSLPSNTLSLPNAGSSAPDLLPSYTNTDPISIEYNIQINRQTTLSTVYHYPANALVEYPETSQDGRIGHIFTLDPNAWISPYLNFAYSLGGSHGSSKRGTSVTVSALVNLSGEKVPCREMHTTC